ncbi:MAG: FAD-binding oxidoreductase, partial [Hyphomicrobiaceae bacterium]|nr:FAD-binding oxidoreductase [Hyphomicrobiaceae bacterium]
HGLTFGPDPATHVSNTLGGMIGNNSGGVHALMHGITVHNVQEMEVLTYDGLRLTVGPTSEAELRAILAAGGRRAEIYQRLEFLRHRYGDQIRRRFPQIPRRVSGYGNLDQLFREKGFNVARALVGTEGTCVTVLAATLNLIPRPPERVIAIIGFPDICEAADAVPRVLGHDPIGLEGFDQKLIEGYKAKSMHLEDLKILPEGKGWLLVEFGADDKENAVAQANRLVRELEGQPGVDPKLVRDDGMQARFWAVRDDSLGAESYVPNHPDTWPGWEDSAVHPSRLGAYLRDLEGLFHRYGYDPNIYGHFGGGVVHCAVAFQLYDEAGLRQWRKFLGEAAELVTRHGGSLSGEHGDGQARAQLLETMYGPELVEAFREFKRIWDPEGRMNPGKVIDPYPITSNLRLGPEYKPPQLDTHFAFRNEGGFDRAAQRCVGIGKCRRIDSGAEVMCPSYLVTREEMHSTRGRARLLFEMLRGDPVRDGWRSREVEEALSLCLACKGCKSDCPVNVDMASYKAEFRAHHYRWRLRHRSAYSMGLVYWWSRLASKAPWLANAAMEAPGLGSAIKMAGGIAPQRKLPPFAQQTFTRWFRQREPQAGGGPRVLLWPDTFNNYFRPETAIAATRVLEAAGFEVAIPCRPLCCGRPLYDWGWLDRASALWRQTMATLREEIAAGTPIVGLEPACVAAFKDELPDLFPDDRIAQQLSDQTVYFADFVDRHVARLPHIEGRALVHVHCHHHAVIKDKGELSLLGRLGLACETTKAGCCGMAGAFGFASDTHDVGLAAGERVLLPKVRAAAPDTLVLADGFSCREQIEQGTGRATLHVAELIERGLRNEIGPRAGPQ